MNKENLIKILTDLKEVRTKTLTKVSDDTLFDTAIRVYNSESISNNRQGNKPIFNERSKTFTSFHDSPATIPQINKLKKLGYKGMVNELSKKEASKLIDKLLTQN